jgi:hypothetical protein
VRVRADEIERRQIGGALRRLQRRSRLDGHAELGVFLAGLDVLVRVRLYARRDAEHDPLHDTRGLRDAGEAFELVE